MYKTDDIHNATKQSLREKELCELPYDWLVEDCVKNVFGGTSTTDFGGSQMKLRSLGPGSSTDIFC